MRQNSAAHTAGCSSSSWGSASCHRARRRERREESEERPQLPNTVINKTHKGPYLHKSQTLCSSHSSGKEAVQSTLSVNDVPILIVTKARRHSWNIPHTPHPKSCYLYFKNLILFQSLLTSLPLSSLFMPSPPVLLYNLQTRALFPVGRIIFENSKSCFSAVQLQVLQHLPRHSE